MPRSRWFNKLLACLTGILAGGSLMVAAQNPGPIKVRGSGGDSIQEAAIPIVGNCSNCDTYNFGGYVVHAFTQTGATHTFTPPAGVTSVDVLIVAGGGGGGGDRYGGGGGGAGGLLWLTTQAVTPLSSINVVVGAGGAAGAANNGKGGDGGNSSFGGQTATGGGGGGAGDQGNNANGNGNDGGSGGGGGARTSGGGPPRAGGTGIVGQGNDGGDGTESNNQNNQLGGGGGGADAAGDSGVTGTGGTARGGNGGSGRDFSTFFGTTYGEAGWFAGGGGGGKRTGGGGGIGGTSGGIGGQGGGGDGGSNVSGLGVAAQANTGGGGGGSGSAALNAGGAGGSGIVLVRYVPQTVDYVVHTFLSDGVFTPPPGVSTVEVLVVGGGGGGGSSFPFGDAGSGGGGAGGVVFNSNVAVAGPVNVTVGAGGAGGNDPLNFQNGANGGNSVFGTVVALGGGGGVGGNGQGVSGGSGGGSRGAPGGIALQPGSASGGFGNNGGDIPGSPAGAPGSGGGGAGGPAPNLAGTFAETGHNGGPGLQFNMTGTPTFYAGGGGGGTAQNRTAVSSGGIGGGGAGGRTDTPATPGTANTGGGGGGGNDDSAGANGGSGIVIVRYRAPTLEILPPQPDAVVSGAVLNPAPVVRLLNFAGTPLSGINITGAIDFGTATLGGTTTVATNASGLATFNNLTLTGAPGTIRLGFTVANANPASKVVSNDIDIITLHFRITHGTHYGLCQPFTPITIEVWGSNNQIFTGYTGSVTVTSSGGHGNFVPAPGYAGTFVNSGSGSAQYGFTGAENGVLVLRYSTSTQGLLTFNAFSGSIVTENYALSLNVGLCRIRIAYPDGATGDVCTALPVELTAVDNAGAALVGYTGTISLSTTTLKGNWVKPLATSGSITAFGGGAANYTFDGSTNVVELGLFHESTTSSLNINVVATGFSVDPLFDPDATIVGCEFRISLAPNEVGTCSATTVTLGVYDRNGILATDYAGLVSLSTTTSHGTWLSSNGGGTLIDNSPGNGTGSYNFVSADDGEVELTFNSTFIEALFFSPVANDGAITIDDNFDPQLVVTACVPVVTDAQCYQSSSVGSALTLPSSAATQGSRMVLMYVGSESSPATPATGATFASTTKPADLLYRNTTVTPAQAIQVYAFLDSELPANAGTYGASFTGGGGGAAMCLVAVSGVEQILPQTAVPPESGQLNGAVAQTGGFFLSSVATNITTLKNNSLVLGASVTSSPVAITSTYTELASNTAFPGSILWSPSEGDDPAGAGWRGSYHVVPSPGEVNLTDSFTLFAFGGNLGAAQILLALNPLVEDPPFSASFVPVTIYRTMSGNVNYRVIGNTLRSADNSNACALVPESTGSAATLNIPAGANITEAYLYWAGSGGEEATPSPPTVIIDNNIRFGLDNPSRPYFDADQMFIVERPLNRPVSFFAGYKDVTDLITDPGGTYRFSDLEVDTSDAWSTTQACVAGWALVVVFEHPDENLNVINLFHGFQPFYQSSFTLVPRNFRMAQPDDVRIPNGQLTHVTFEGDAGSPLDSGEFFELQNTPNVNSFTNLNNFLNVGDIQYNSTITYPIYDGSLDFDPGAGNAGYIGFNDTWGVDIDTYYVQGAVNGEILYPFGQQRAEQITTRYASGGDLVLLTGEFIAITNEPIADLEIFVSGTGNFKVGSSGTSAFVYEVVNNGDGGVNDGGYANGDVLVSGNMPTGITIASFTAPGWDCSVATATAFTCVFEIASDWVTGLGASVNGQLRKDEYLPDIVVNVNVGDDSFFPLLNNDISTVGRLSHVLDFATTCGGLVAGQQPDPQVCDLSPQFDNVNDLNKYLIDIDDLTEKSVTNNNVARYDRNVRGIETNLSITKSLVGILEVSEPATYQLTVTNLGPDATTKTITVTDTLPAGLPPDTASGTDWTCGAVGQTVTCTRTVSLGVGASSNILLTTLPLVAPAVEGNPVTNTATVAIAAGNFDNVAGNNSSTSNAVVTGPVASGTERFLLSVSKDGSSIGGLGPFNRGDLVIYDPITDTAEMFLDEGDIPNTNPGDLGDINAVHLLPNGWVILSTATDGANINGVTFNSGDLVIYDPILQTATLFFDGSAIFAGNAMDEVDIDAVHVLFNDSYNPLDWEILLSTTDTATIGATTFENNDIVRYTMNGGAVAVVVSGASGDLFGGTDGDIGALYQRYDDVDAWILSTSDVQASVGVGGTDPATIERGELVEVILDGPGNPETETLFCDDQDPCIGLTPGIFTPAGPDRRLDAVHVVEAGYFGHFAIASLGGDTCSPTSITISRHAGTGHSVDTNYKGSILVSTNLGEGVWAADASAKGSLVDLGNGVARYTFVDGGPGVGDQGEVILFITGIEATDTLNIDVRTNINTRTTITLENAPAEDPNIQVSNLVTEMEYRDDFNTPVYNNNDGSHFFAAPWDETGDDDSPTTGGIRIQNDELRFENPSGGRYIERTINFGSTEVATPELKFDFNKENNPNFALSVSVCCDAVDAWVPLATLTNATVGGAKSYELSGVDTTDPLTIRFALSGTRINSTERFLIDNVQLLTENYDCDAGGSVDHYAVSHSGSMVSCLAELVTITPHLADHSPTVPATGTIIQLRTSTNKGFWGPPSAPGPFTTAATNNGAATYTFTGVESAVVFPFYYTDLTAASEVVVIEVYDENLQPLYTLAESPQLTVGRTGLRFYNETLGSEVLPTMVSGMRSDRYPNHVLTVHAVNSVNEPGSPPVCEAAFPDNTEVELELAFECADPGQCADPLNYQVQVINNSLLRASVPPVNDNGGSGVLGGYVPMNLYFTTGDLGEGAGSYSRAELVLNYPDAGRMQIHGRRNIIVEDEDGQPLASDDYMESSSNSYVVRPFGFDIRLEDQDHYNNSALGSSWAEDADGSRFWTAGQPFDAVLRAVAWNGTELADTNVDGVPDNGADLSGFPTTPNFGNEIAAATNDVEITHTLVAPASVDGGVLGDLTGGESVEIFTAGETPEFSLRYDEVGIIDLEAGLVSGDYLGGGEDVVGQLLNVGRFIPADFTVTEESLTARPLFPPNTGGNFTYMGEEFNAAFTLTARNALGTATVNYQDGFAKLTGSDLSFFAVEDGGAESDTSYTARLSDAVTPANAFPANFAADWAQGELELDGNLILQRQASGAPDGPLGPIRIAVTAVDSDSVADIGRTVTDDQCVPLDCSDVGDPKNTTGVYNLIGELEFRYGRLRLENGYGSEVPDQDELGNPVERDVMIGVVAEYWNGSEFIVNLDDIATPYDSAELDFVTGSYTENLNASEASVSSGIAGVIYQGATLQAESNVDENDLPLYLTAPGEGNEGTAMVELDLDALGLGFLKYDWRDDLYEVVDGNPAEDDGADIKLDPDAYGDTDDPRALIEFGVFRGNSRIINWQEIFTGDP